MTRGPLHVLPVGPRVPFEHRLSSRCACAPVQAVAIDEPALIVWIHRASIRPGQDAA